jgi:hypothetical protein
MRVDAGEMMASKFSGETMFRKTADLLESEVDEQVVALDVDKGQCYGLNAVGSQVWRMLDTPMSLQEICSALQDEYEVEPELCRDEVGRLLADLQSEGLVEVQA